MTAISGSRPLAAKEPWQRDKIDHHRTNTGATEALAIDRNRRNQDR